MGVLPFYYTLKEGSLIGERKLNGDRWNFTMEVPRFLQVGV